MAGENTAVATATYAATVVAVGPGALEQVFNQLMLVYAIMGAAGGVALGLFTQGTPLREIMRGGFLGMLLATGLGVAAPYVVAWAFPVDVGQVHNNVQLLAASSFIVGLGQNWIIDRLTRGKGLIDASPDADT